KTAAKPRWLLGLAASALAAVAGCSMFRLSGYAVRPEKPGRGTVIDPYRLPTPEEKEAFRVLASSAGTRVEPPFEKSELSALYYYDLGPTEIDVSAYPAKQQANYEVFRQVCSKCHTLARPINSPRGNYWAWDFYIFTMRMRGQFDPQTAFTADQAKQILSFLTYDSKVRKGEHREAFELRDRALQRRFERMLDERIHSMQRGRTLLRPKQ
ncbi:MAG TPA: hypothetical protein VNI01_01655, partial [Elusimicrobiota bacterium]|nr:hypothetical protein [Elusimicrobiota bacterium]